MKSLFVRLLAPLLLGLVLTLPVRAEVHEAAWSTDYPAALAKAKADKKLVLLDFTGSDWCGWCKRLHREVFSQEAFKTWAESRFELVVVDFPRSKKLDAALVKQNDQLQDKFQIEGYPTIVVVDGDGKEVGRGGYVEGGPAAFSAQIEAFLPKAK